MWKKFIQLQQRKKSKIIGKTERTSNNSGEIFIAFDVLGKIKIESEEVLKLLRKERENFSKILLTIYTPITSGLVFLSTSVVDKFEGRLGFERLSFSIIIFSSVLIVLFALIERFSYVLAWNERNRVYWDHVYKTGKPIGDGIFRSNPWIAFLIKSQVYLQPILIIVNVTSILWFTMLRIY